MFCTPLRNIFRPIRILDFCQNVSKSRVLEPFGGTPRHVVSACYIKTRLKFFSDFLTKTFSIQELHNCSWMVGKASQNVLHTVEKLFSAHSYTRFFSKCLQKSGFGAIWWYSTTCRFGMLYKDATKIFHRFFDENFFYPGAA